MGKIRVSVALASYNGEAYVKEQIESILKNLSAEDEIVVSDDGSTDRTLDRIEECKGNKVPITVVKGEGRGIKQIIAGGSIFFWRIKMTSGQKRKWKRC